MAHTRADPTKNIIACDLHDTAKLQKVVSDFKPFAIVHCAAERRPDVCSQNPDAARSLNIEYAQRKKGNK